MSTRTARSSKLQNERNAAALRELLKKPANKKCADCKRNDPRWASWNLGIFICIRCSGVHRSMGTHISKVKSIDLDTWTPEQIENMKKWGNFKANKYWEAKLTPADKFQESNFERWIRSKYEFKRFTNGDEIPDPSTIPDENGESSAVLSNSSVKNSVKPLLNTEEATGVFSKVENSDSNNELINTKPEKSQTENTNIFFQDIMNTPAKNSTSSFNSFALNNTSEGSSKQNSQNNSLKSSIMSLYNTPSQASFSGNQNNPMNNYNSNSNSNNFSFSAFQSTNSNPMMNNNNNNQNFMFSNQQVQNNNHGPIPNMNMNTMPLPLYSSTTTTTTTTTNQTKPKKSDPFDFVSLSSFSNSSKSSLNNNKNNIPINNININTNNQNNNNDEFSDFQTASAHPSNNWANF